MAEVAFEFRGRAKVLAIIDAARSAVGDVRPFFRDFLIPDIREMYRQQFDTEGARGGAKWVPLSPAYAAWKEANFPGKSILRRTDRLFDSLTSKTSDTIEIATDQQLRIGTKLIYGSAHQGGTGTLPARPMLAPTPADLRRWRGLGERYITDQLKGRRTAFR